MAYRKVFSFNRQETVRTFTVHAASAVLILTTYASLRCFKLAKSLYLSSNNVLKTVFNCFINSRYFTELCMLCGISVMNMRFNEIHTICMNSLK